MNETVTGEWIDVLVASVGKYFSLETSDGILREGKLTGITCREFVFNGKKIQVPLEIILNGDPNDRVPVLRISTIEFS